MKLKILTLTVLITLLGVGQISAQSYKIPEIHTEVSINPDGTVQITEHLTYQFEGSFSWADYRLPKKGYSALLDIHVLEDGQPYSRADSEEPGTFSISENEEDIQIQWFYNAEDEQRTFTLSYTLEDAIVVGPEWSEFFWNYLSEDRPKSTEQITISIYLPKGVPADSLYGWTRGPERQIELQTSERGYAATARNISNNSFVKLRTVFPTAAFNKPEVEITDTDFSLAAAQQDEQNFRKEDPRQEELAGLANRINYIIVVLSLFIFYMVFQKYGKRHSTSRLSSQETVVIPDNTRPGPIGWLLTRRTVSTNELAATILDMARRGYFIIKEQPPEEGILKGDKPTFSVERTGKELQDDLLDWEESIIHFVERELDDNTEKLDKMLENVAMKSSGWFANWGEMFEEHCYNLDWIDLKSYTGAYINTALQLLLLIIGLGFTVYVGPRALSPFGLLAMLLITMVAAAMSVTIVRRTEQGEKTYQRWQNYKKGLQNAANHNIPSNELDKHFIYAVALMIQGENLEQIFTSASGELPTFSWFTFRNLEGASAAAAASMFSTLGATAAGGGASGGASAGSAGGGAAAGAG